MVTSHRASPTLLAAFATVRIVAVDAPAADGSQHAVFACEGDAGEGAFKVDLILQGIPTKDELARRVFAACDGATARAALAKLLPVGQTLARPAAIELTPKQQFQRDASLLVQIAQMVSAGALAGDEKEITDLRTKTQGEYQPGFLQGGIQP